MNKQARIGERITIMISISILLLSLYTSINLYVANPELSIGKLISNIIRFLLTLGLLNMIYKGKKWARIVGLILFLFGLLAALIQMNIPLPWIYKLPLIVMAVVYFIAILHFGFSKYFKAFYSY